MTSLFPPFNRRSSFRKQPYFYEAGRGVNYKSTGGPFPTLDLNFLSGTLDPRITFSRASNATLTDSTGKITYAPNNLLLNSATLSTQTVSTGFSAGDRFVLSFSGTGSVAISDGYTGTLAGTGVSDRVSLSFSTTTTSLTFTVTGSVTSAQLERVTYQTTPSTYNATTTAAYYGPRFDYDPVTLAAKGLLIEEARTNLLTYSAQFDNAAWVKFALNTTGTPPWVNVGVAPDGTQTADKFTENTVAAFHYMDRTLTISASTAYTFSVYLKAGERTFGGAHIYENGAARGCSINLTTGALGTPYGGATASAVSVGNGWYRLSVTITSSTTTALPAIYLSNTNALAAYTGDGTSGIFVWGAQFEAGAFATSYIPTVASSVARSADIATMTGTNFSSWYNASAGTFWTLFDGPASGTKAIVAADNNTANNNIQLYTSSTDPKFLVADGGVTQADIDAGTVAARTQYKFAGAYATNDFAAAIAGNAAVTDTSGTAPTVDRLRIGSNQAGNYLGGHVAAIKYYNQRLTDAKLQALTI